VSVVSPAFLLALSSLCSSFLFFYFSSLFDNNNKKKKKDADNINNLKNSIISLQV